VSLGDVEDLLSRPARAAIAYAGPNGPECVPVVVRRDGSVRIGVHSDTVLTTGTPRRSRSSSTMARIGSSCAPWCGGAPRRQRGEKPTTRLGRTASAGFDSKRPDSSPGTIGDSAEKIPPHDANEARGRHYHANTPVIRPP